MTMTMRSVYSISIDGRDVTSNFDPVLMSMSITDHEGGKSDTLEIELDDADGKIALPRSGADIKAILGWVDGGSVSFEGKTDASHSRGSRGGGRVLTLNAHSVDFRSKAKEPQRRHKDDAAFGDVAREWGENVGLTVKVDSSLAAIHRDYWHIDESFLAWGTRIAADLGATFKVRGTTAVFVPRGAATSPDGRELATVSAICPGNVIAWDMTPAIGRMAFGSHRVRWYDPKEAKWKQETVEDSAGGEAASIERFAAASQDRAQSRAQSNKAEADRKKGGGTITLNGEPTALAQATCIVTGLREGIDGTYRITGATHSLNRQSGYLTRIEVEQPGGSAGSDARAKSPHAPAGGIGGGAGNVRLLT